MGGITSQRNNKAGALLVFQRDASNQWTQLGQRIDGDQYGSNLGRDVRISSDGKTIVGTAQFGCNSIAKDHPWDCAKMGWVQAWSYDASDKLWKTLGQTLVGTQERKRYGTLIDTSADCKTLAITSIYYDGPTYK